ncbi:MAG TPA: ribonuclease P protein component [Steroidobacteraceae bacterium]|nr:ribonuclease P protein component [Steroidobacteraceae bacterium]
MRTAPLQRLRLQPQRRIRRKSEFDAAYAHGQRLGNGFFAVTVYSRTQDDSSRSGPDPAERGHSGLGRRGPGRSGPADGGPRIGLAVAVRIAGSSVERNRIRRVIRESFRLHQHELPAADLVVSARARSRGASGPELRAALAALWKKVAAICATSPPS